MQNIVDAYFAFCPVDDFMSKRQIRGGDIPAEVIAVAVGLTISLSYDRNAGGSCKISNFSLISKA